MDYNLLSTEVDNPEHDVEQHESPNLRSVTHATVSPPLRHSFFPERIMDVTVLTTKCL